MRISSRKWPLTVMLTVVDRETVRNTAPHHIPEWARIVLGCTEGVANILVRTGMDGPAKARRLVTVALTAVTNRHAAPKQVTSAPAQ